MFRQSVRGVVRSFLHDIRSREGSGRTRRPRPMVHFRPLACEPLEDRRLLSAVSSEQALLVGSTFWATHLSDRGDKLVGGEAVSLAAEAQAGQSQEAWAVSPILGEKGTAVAYVVEPEPEGFVIIAGDDDISPLLGYSSTGDFPFKDSSDNALLHLVQWDMEARLATLSSATDESESLAESNSLLWEQYLSNDPQLPSGPVPSTTYGPWLDTNWHQGGRYNNKCPYKIPYVPGWRRPVGCVATAMAQIINYWQFPSSVSFSSEPWPDGDGYSKNGISFDEDASKYGFPTFAELESALAVINYDDGDEEVAFLNFAAGVKLQMSYGGIGSGSGANTGDVASALRNSFSFASAIRRSKISGLWNEYRSEAIDDLKAGWPLQIAIHKSGGWDGHSVIVDGYRDTDEYFHVNFGWGNTTTTWYDLPDSFESYDVVHTIVHNICPYQGWNQPGADSQNTMSTVYTIPTTEPDEKWEVEVPSDFDRYSFTHMVVGTSGKIYAAMSPMDVGQGKHPQVCVISPHGHLEKLIPITDSDHKIQHLTQNSRGEVFFGSSEWNDKTTFYKIDPKTDAVSPILNHTSPDRGIFDQPIKVDGDDYLYFVITPKFVGNAATFYCRKPSGSAHWSHTFSSDMKFSTSVAAIDEGRDHVYLNYYDSSTSQSKLACFDRRWHDLKWTYTFPGTHTNAEMAGPPIVGPDGSVYVGCNTKVYAISPNGAKQWEQDFYPSYTNGELMRALAKDGTLYVAHGKMVSSAWHPSFISALDTSDNGAIKWTEEVYTPQTSGDSIGEVMVGSNGVVGFTYHHDGSDVWHTAALTDEGGSATLLWDLEDYGGTMAFGPSQTFYVIPNTWADDSIFALSVGERGDPDGLGMAYTNNTPPAAPSNPSPADGSQGLDTNVTLSWACSDPQGHTLNYDLFVGDATSVMLPVATGLQDTFYTVSDLLGGTSYIWKVVATDGQAVNESITWTLPRRT